MSRTSRIEQLIDEIEDLIVNSKPKFMSNTEIIVNKDEIEDLINELRKNTPDEIKRYQKIISNQEAILADAKAKAKSLIDEATVHTNELINEHEIMQRAYEEANEVVTMATQKAQDILDNATMEANSLRAAAMQYTDDLLAHLESIIAGSTQSAISNYESLIGSLNQYHDLIQTNRNELYPAEVNLDDEQLIDDNQTGNNSDIS